MILLHSMKGAPAASVVWRSSSMSSLRGWGSSVLGSSVMASLRGMASFLDTEGACYDGYKA